MTQREASTSPETRATGPRRAVLIVPNGAINPRTGGGQRTALLYEALAEIAPLTIVVLGLRHDHDAAEFFPNANEVIGLPLRDFMLYQQGGWDWAKSVFERLVVPGRAYRVAAEAPASLNAELGDLGESLIAFRYYRTFAKSGLGKTSAPGVRCAVDVDDRDDTKIGEQLRARLGARLGGAIYRQARPSIWTAIRSHLDRLDLIWLAKPEDRFEHPGLDQRVLSNVPALVPDPADLVPAGDGNGLFFVGTPQYPPNFRGILWFLDTCWPQVRDACPDATLRIVGLGDWSALEARHGATPGVTIVGTVDSIGAEYNRARAAICPIFEGAGSQIKVIEACGFARPVVASRLAASGFGSEIEVEISGADDPAAFAQACIDLLTAPEAATRKGNALRALQQARYSKAAAIARIRDDVASLWADSGQVAREASA